MEHQPSCQPLKGLWGCPVSHWQSSRAPAILSATGGIPKALAIRLVTGVEAEAPAILSDTEGSPGELSHYWLLEGAQGCPEATLGADRLLGLQGNLWVAGYLWSAGHFLGLHFLSTCHGSSGMQTTLSTFGEHSVPPAVFSTCQGNTSTRLCRYNMHCKKNMTGN